MKKDLAHKMIFGVCAGIANSLGIDPAIVRLAFVVLALMGFGLPVIVYLVMALLLPSE